MPTDPEFPPSRRRTSSRWAGWRAGATAVITILGLLAAWAALVPHG